MAGVEVRLNEGPRTTGTDSTGLFTFRNLQPDLYHVTLRRLGFEPITGTVRLLEGDSIDIHFRMRAAPVLLGTIRVQEDALAAKLWSGFDGRRAAGFGVFLTAADLDAHAGSSLGEILQARVSGVAIQQFLPNQWAAVEVYRGAAETPLEFDATGAECGTIVIWTRKGRRELPQR